jgi:signal transduction histidine kinase
MGLPLRVLPTSRPVPPAPPPPAESEGAEAWRREREELLGLLAQQQRVAQAGLVTSGLAHDLNNHIQAASGMAFLALRGQPEDWKEALERIQDRCCAMADTTQAFLSFVGRRAEVDDGRFRLSDVVESAARLAGPLAREHSVRLSASVTEDASVRGEARLAIQALVNLVTNAVRACAEDGGQVRIEAYRSKPGSCRLIVRDDGPGIPDEVRPRLFRPLVTGSGDSGGNGFGLFIVRQTVRRLGGAIRVQTSRKGTAFRIDLPCIE